MSPHTIPSRVVLVLALAIAPRLAAQGDTRPGDTVNQLSRSAEQRLAQSIEELTRLRETIAAEKVPLGQELTTLEERAAGQRKEYDAIARTVDAGNLELATLKGDLKVRQDELAYIGNLLDEYARTMESKLHVSELQSCGQAIDVAKQATENTALTMSEKFTRQVELARVSLRRLFEVVGGLQFPGVAVDLQGTVLEGRFAILGPVALFQAAAAGVAGLAIPQSGSTRPLIRPLDGEAQAGLVAVVQDGDGLLPLDPLRGGALKALVQQTNIYHIFEKGGPIMWPLLFASVLALGTVLERLLFLMRERWRRSPRAMEELFAAVEKGDLDGAIRIGERTRDFIVRAFGYALAHKEKSLPNALLYAQARELRRYQRGIPILDTVITLAPLLGLLGTVTGMMGSFSLIGGELSAPGAITGGIAEALIATAFGLGIAITALLPFNFLNAKLEQARHEFESASKQLELLLHPQAPAPAGAPPSVAGPARHPHQLAV